MTQIGAAEPPERKPHTVTISGPGNPVACPLTNVSTWPGCRCSQGGQCRPAAHWLANTATTKWHDWVYLDTSGSDTR